MIADGESGFGNAAISARSAAGLLSCAGGGAYLQWTQDTTHSDAGTFQWVSGLWWTPDPTTNGCLDNEGEAATDGTRQILYHCINNHGNQEWIFTP